MADALRSEGTALLSPGENAETPKTSAWIQFENNVEVIVDPKSHIPHFLLFLLCAGCTVGYTITSLKVDRGVVLTNFKMLRPLDLTAAEADTHAALASRWKCSTPVNVTAGAVARRDPWGPDSMCRCIAMRASVACTTKEACATVEKTCYANVVPVYAHVYAGQDVSGLNIVIAFFSIHMAVLLNMAAETAKDEALKLEGDSKDGKGKQLEVQTQKDTLNRVVTSGEDNFDTFNEDGASLGLGKVVYGSGNQMIMGRFARLGAFKDAINEGNGEWNTPTEYAAKKQEGVQDRRERNEKYREDQHFFQTQKDDHNRGVDTHKADLNKTYAHMGSKLIKNKFTQLVLFTLLTITSLIFSIVRLTKIPNGSELQKCDLDNACMTQSLLSVVTMTLCILDGFLCFGAILLASQSGGMWTHSEFAISTYEDMHNMVAFMLLAASFGALSGVHDDTTLLFDVLVIMVIGFLQAVQHNAMLAKEVFITHCEKANLDGKIGMLKDGMDKEHYVCTTILSFFLYTRLFIFVLITGCSYTFYMRLASSVGSGETTANWNMYMRFLVSLVALTPSFFGDFAYEMNHTRLMNKEGVHLQYSGAHMWRRTIYLMYIIFFAVLSWKTYKVENTA